MACAAHGVAKSQTGLSALHVHFTSLAQSPSGGGRETEERGDERTDTTNNGCMTETNIVKQLSFN